MKACEFFQNYTDDPEREAERRRKRDMQWTVDDVWIYISNGGNIAYVAEWLLQLCKNTRANGEQLDDLGLKLEAAVFIWLKRNKMAIPTSDKTSQVLALPDDELLEVVKNARAKGVKLSPAIEAAELRAFNRSKEI